MTKPKYSLVEAVTACLTLAMRALEEVRSLAAFVKDDARDFGIDDIDIEYDGERTLSVVIVKRGREKCKSFTMPALLDRGVYREATAYQRGDCVTWGGSMWIAQKDTDAKPGEGDGWRLAVKRGRDGKDAKG